MKFDPEHPNYKRIAYISGIIATICGLVTVYFLFLSPDPIFIETDREPVLVVIGDTPWVRMDYGWNSVFPDSIKPYKKPATDSLESEIFQYKKQINENILRLKRTDKFNIDSLVASITPEQYIDVYPRLQFNLTIKNNGDKVAKIVLYMISDTLTTENFLLSNLIKGFNDSQVIEQNSPEFPSILIKPDSLQDVSFPKYTPQFGDNEHRFNTHLCLIYIDPDSNYYALYHIIQYQALDNDFAIFLFPVYKQISNELWVLDVPSITPIFKPRPPTFKDIYRFITKKEFMEYRFTDKERELIRKNYYRKRHS